MRAAEWIATVPWCITDQALEAMISIAERAPLDDAAERFHGPTSLALRAGAQRDDSQRLTMRDGVALLRIDGPIYRYADFFSAVSGGVTTEALGRDLQLALDDARVAAILLVVDSPGGEATGIGELAGAIMAGRERKPIWAYVEGYGASAAYWLASAAERVIIDPSARLGSIGTVMAVANPAARPQPARAIEVVSTQSPKKRLDPTTQAGRDELQRLVDVMTEVFIGAVQQQRNLSREAVLAVEGGLRVGQEAIDAGLADALGSEEGAIAALQQEAAAHRVRPAVFQPRRIAATLQEIGMSKEKGGLREFWASFWGGAQDAGIISPTPSASDGAPEPIAASLVEAQPTTATPPAPIVDAERDRAELERLRSVLAERDAAAVAALAAQRTTAAGAFAERLITEQRAVPAERDALIAAHAAASTAGPAVLAAVEAAYAARPAHVLTAEQIATGDVGILPLARPESGDAVPTSAEIEALLAQTPLGRAALAARRAR